MKNVERWIFKLAVLHLVLLLITQAAFHQFHLLHQFQKITYYEGVAKSKKTPYLETWKGK